MYFISPGTYLANISKIAKFPFKGIGKTTHKLTRQVQKKPFAYRDLGINDDRQKQRDGKNLENRGTARNQIFIFTKICVVACKVLESVDPACEENSACKPAKKHVLHVKSV